MSLVKPAAIFVDNDGTAKLTERAWFETINRVSKKHNGPSITEDQWWNDCSGAGHGRIWQYLQECDAKNEHPLFRIGKEEFIMECIKSFDFGRAATRVITTEAIPNLHAAGVLIIPFSSSPEAFVSECWERMGLAQYVTAGFYGKDTLERLRISAKPKPESYRVLANHLGLQIEHCDVWDDSPTSCHGARVAGGASSCTVLLPARHGSHEESKSFRTCHYWKRWGHSFLELCTIMSLWNHTRTWGKFALRLNKNQ